jgi:hypothetical protein
MTDRAAAAEAAEDAAEIAKIVPFLCDQLEHKRELLEILAEERSNPAGVVNLRDLHETGVAIQFTDVRIKEARTDFRKRARKPFSEKLCTNSASVQ